MSDCRDALRDKSISLSIVSDIGLSKVGKLVIGSFVRGETSALLKLGPLTSMSGSDLSWAVESICGFDLTRLLVEGFDAAEEDLLFSKMWPAALLLGCCSRALLPFCWSPHEAEVKKSSILQSCSGFFGSSASPGVVAASKWCEWQQLRQEVSDGCRISPVAEQSSQLMRPSWSSVATPPHI